MTIGVIGSLESHLKEGRTRAVVSELSEFVGSIVEPAILKIQANESRAVSVAAHPTDCFGSVAGRLLRSRCCVYFSNLAGSLIEARFGSLRPSRASPLGFLSTDPDPVPPTLEITFELLAKWLLAHDNDPLALGVRAERVSRCTFENAGSAMLLQNYPPI